MSIRWDSHRLAALVEDVKFLHESGVSPQHWPVRVGKTRVALVRTLYRQGKSDLACLLKEEGDVQMAGGSINLAARVISDEHVDALRDFWNAIDRIQRETGQHLTLPCEADPDMWFSIDATGQAQAASACQECPVISACRDLADAPPRPREGIWAGRDYGRKYTALLCNDCGTGWWPLGRKEENSVAQLYCPACREKTPFRKRSRT